MDTDWFYPGVLIKLIEALREMWKINVFGVIFVNEPFVNGQRLWTNVLELGRIGKGERGVSRIAFSEADLHGRRWFLEKIKEAGLSATIDEVGNVFGWEPVSGSKKILVGSHLDTVPEGGMFDGALGVLCALECVQTIRERNIRLSHGIQIAGFSNEEGYPMGPGLFGSRYFAEGIGEKEHNVMEPFLAKAGFHGLGSGRNHGAFDPSDYLCYLELHVEQGGVLDSVKEHIGVVQGIVGIHRLEVRFNGVPNHAGTTPMNHRRDALLGAAALILELPDLVSKHGSDITVGTCGQVHVSPGAHNVIPGNVSISIEVRDLEAETAENVLEALNRKSRDIAEKRSLSVEFSPVSKSSPAKMDGEIQAVILDTARSLGLSARLMPSGAGHDGAVFAEYVPTGMIFVPSRNGISHSPDEWTEPQDCVNGANVLLRTLLKLAR
jgi:N-carbamoyl-L-amino-acid hydrolase